MARLAWLTLVAGLRSRSLVLLALTGVLVLLAGQGLSILALGGESIDPTGWVGATAFTWGSLAALLLLLNVTDADSRSAFAWAAQQTDPGSVGWQVARLWGAWGAGAACSTFLLLSAVLLLGTAPDGMYLYLTIICAILPVCAWGCLWTRLTRSSTAALALTLLVLLLGHLPWGAAGWAGEWGTGWGGRALGALLPRPPTGTGDPLHALLGALGLFGFALALPPVLRSPA